MRNRLHNPIMLLAAALMLLPGCTQQHEASFDGLHDGMSREQVRELLGEPTSTFYDTEERRAEAGGVYQERWQYGDNFSTRATGAMFPENAPDRVWVVYSEDGKVSGFREPLPPSDPWRSDVK